MFKRTQKKLTYVNAMSYFLFLVLFLGVFYVAFVQILNEVQREMVESYASSNIQKFFTVYNGPPPPPNRFELEVDKMNFYYVISNELEVLAGEELYDGFHETLEENLQHVKEKQFTTYSFAGESLIVMLQPIQERGQTLGYVAVGQTVTQYKQLMQNVLWLMVGLLIASSLAIAVLSYVLAKKSMRPIEIAYEQQRQFVANASHELRTPLSVLSSSLQLFEEQLQQNNSPYDKQSFKEINDEALYMNDMLSSLLYLTRADQQQIALHKTEVDLTTLLVNRARSIAKTVSHVTFSMDVEDEIYMKADKTLLSELLIILLKNAVTYTKEGTIYITLYQTELSYVIEIKDTGIGIATEDLPHIFERFYRADKMRSSSGTGLGLAIAKTIADLHKASIKVSSEIDKGSTFTLVFPKSD